MAHTNSGIRAYMQERAWIRNPPYTMHGILYAKKFKTALFPPHLQSRKTLFSPLHSSCLSAWRFSSPPLEAADQETGFGRFPKVAPAPPPTQGSGDLFFYACSAYNPPMSMMDEKTLPRERFGDTDVLANELALLVAAGIKTATCSAYTKRESAGKTPCVGDRTIIEDAKGNQVCIIEDIQVEIMPFDQVDAGFAHDEGEGDRSLENWRKTHQAFFERNGGFSPTMPLLCERFKVIKRF